MQIFAKYVDDFKTERKSIAPPLPPYLRLVPLLLYASILAAILFNALFLVRFSQASGAKEQMQIQNRQCLAEKDQISTQRQQMEKETKKATDIVNWVEASVPLQPLVLEIARAVSDGGLINELSLTRSEDNPAQVKLLLRMASDNPNQLEEVQQKITQAQFRIYSPEQSMEKGELDYRATLLWQNSSITQADATP
jgi:ribosomal protein S8